MLWYSESGSKRKKYNLSYRGVVFVAVQSEFLFRKEESSWVGEKTNPWRRSKRGSGENGAGYRRAMIISNSWGEAAWELSGDMPGE